MTGRVDESKQGVMVADKRSRNVFCKLGWFVIDLAIGSQGLAPSCYRIRRQEQKPSK